MKKYELVCLGGASLDWFDNKGRANENFGIDLIAERKFSIRNSGKQKFVVVDIIEAYPIDEYNCNDSPVALVAIQPLPFSAKVQLVENDSEMVDLLTVDHMPQKGDCFDKPEDDSVYYETLKVLKTYQYDDPEWYRDGIVAQIRVESLLHML